MIGPHIPGIGGEIETPLEASPQPKTIHVVKELSNFEGEPVDLWYNWGGIMSQFRAVKGVPQSAPLQFHGALFKSKTNPKASIEILRELNEKDEAALEEATRMGGLELYQSDELSQHDQFRLRGSFCLWKNPKLAWAAISGPAHMAAVDFAIRNECYSKYEVWPFTILDDGQDVHLMDHSPDHWLDEDVLVIKL